MEKITKYSSVNIKIKKIHAGCAVTVPQLTLQFTGKSAKRQHSIAKAAGNTLKNKSLNERKDINVINVGQWCFMEIYITLSRQH